MRRRQFTLTDRLILRISGCLLLVLLPIAAVLACALVFQGLDLMAGEPDATSARRLSRMAATPSTNHLAAEPAWLTPQAVPIAHVAGRATAAPLPARSPRYQSTPTPGFISRLFAAAVNVFSETAPTPTHTLAVIPEATPTLPPPPPPTNTPTLMPSPTPAATPSSQPSPTALPTATPTPLVAQVSSDSTVNVRAGPGTNYPVVGTLQPNNLLPVTGRNQDSTWWQVQQANGQTGWVAAWVVEASDVAGVSVAPTPPPPQSPLTPVPPPTNTSSPTPTPIPEYDFTLAEFFNSPTTNAFLVIYVAIVDTKGIPIGDMKIVGTRLDHNLTYESPLSTWHFEGYNAPGQVIKSGNVKFESPGGIETTSWVLHLEDAQGNRQSDDIPFDVDENDKQWYFIKLGRKY